MENVLQILKLVLCCTWILSIDFACDTTGCSTREDLESWVQNLRNRKEDIGAAEFEHQPLLDWLEECLRQLENDENKIPNEM